MRRDGRIDANQNEIVRYLRDIPGCKVLILSAVGKGCPDLCIGFMGINYLVELKNGDMPPSKRRLTPDEKRFHAQWGGQVAVAKSFEDCLEIIGVSNDTPPF